MNTLPEISTSTAGTIVLELDALQADTLGRVLYAYEALGASVAGTYADNEVVDGYDPDVWNPVALALLGEAAAVHVPFLPTNSQPRTLRVVGARGES